MSEQEVQAADFRAKTFEKIKKFYSDARFGYQAATTQTYSEHVGFLLREIEAHTQAGAVLMGDLHNAREEVQRLQNERDELLERCAEKEPAERTERVAGKTRRKGPAA